jgi:hypothetical protein
VVYPVELKQHVIGNDTLARRNCYLQAETGGEELEADKGDAPFPFDEILVHPYAAVWYKRIAFVCNHWASLGRVRRAMST